MADVVFTITKRSGSKAWGTLKWDDKSLRSEAVTGDSSHEAINIGKWVAPRSKLLDKKEDMYADKKGIKTGHCWMQAFNDAFGRTQIGIHPDGGVLDATAGCIGLKDADTKPWYDALYARDKNMDLIVEVEEKLSAPEVA